MAALRNFNGLASWRNAENSLQSVNLTMPSYWFARQGRPTPDLSRASGFRLYSMLVQAAANGLGAAIGRPMLIARELDNRTLVPLFDRQQEAPERCYLITTAASRQRPELQAFRDWILREARAALPSPAASGFPSHP